jgi:IS5 family transposase
MSGRDQLGFAEAFMSAGLGTNRKLERLDGLIDWSALERLATPVREGRRGRPPYAPLSMLKALYLQALYDLSDPGLEEALLDRLSFRRFCGFALDGGTPDETTICRFRADAGAVLEAAFEEINRQLDAAGLILRKGTLMDATLVAAASRPPPYKAGAGAGSAREPGADWTRKKGRAFFGYKAHLGVDQGSGLIRRVVLSSAKTYESEVADRLICGDEGAVYGDRAYEQQARRARLKAAGIKDRIMHRRNKHMASLPSWQKRRNDLIARRRAPVEAVFSALKRLYGQRRAKSLTLERNTARLYAVATVYNMRRASLLAGA